MQKNVSWCLVFSLLCSVAIAKPGDGDCVVAEFRTLALTVHNPTERLAAATNWLQTHGDACSLKDIAFIKSSSPSWLGSADSPVIQQAFDRYYNAKVKNAREDPAAAAAAPASSPPTPSVTEAAAKPRTAQVPATQPAAASKASAAGATASATSSADAVNTGIAAAVAAAAASKAAASIAKTATNK